MKKVKLTSEDWCKPCLKLKAWMKENNIPYEEVGMGFSTAIPRVQIGHRVAKGLSGCKKLIREEMMNDILAPASRPPLLREEPLPRADFSIGRNHR